MNYDHRVKRLVGGTIGICHRFSRAYSGILVGVENPFINKIQDQSLPYN